MAIRYKNFYHEDPFGFQKFHPAVHAAPDEAMLQARGAELERKQEAALKKVEDLHLDEKTTEGLRGLIKKNLTDKLQDNLDDILVRLEQIDTLKADDPEGYAEILKKFNQYLESDGGVLTKAHDKEILESWYEKKYETIVTKANLDIKKAFAHIFLKKDGERLTDFTSTPDTYDVDFGGLGTLADKKIGLGDIFDERTTVQKLTVTHNGTETEGYRADNGKFYKLSPSGQETQSYLSVRHGDKVRVHAPAIAEIDAEDALEDILAEVGPAGPPPTMAARGADMSPQERAVARASIPADALPLADGSFDHTSERVITEPTRTFVGTSAAPTPGIEADEADLVIAYSPEGQSHYDNLSSRDQEVPLALRDGKDADQVDALHHIDYGWALHGALEDFARIRKVLTGEETDTTTIWFEITRGATKKDKRAITMDELSKAVFGKNFKRVMKEYTKLEEDGDSDHKLILMEQFFSAAEKFFDNLRAMHSAEASGVSITYRGIDEATIREMRESTTLSGDFQVMHTFLEDGLLLDKDELQPNIQLRRLGNRRKRTGVGGTITMDTYAISQGKGQIDPMRVLSPAAAYQQLFAYGMEFEAGEPVANLEAFTQHANDLMRLGFTRIDALAKGDAGDAPEPLTVDQIKNGEITDEQRVAIVYGVAVENAMQLGLDQELTKDFLVTRYGQAAADIVEELQQDPEVNLTNEELLAIAENVNQRVIALIGWLIERIGEEVNFEDMKAVLGVGVPIAKNDSGESIMLDANIVPGMDGSFGAGAGISGSVDEGRFNATGRAGVQLSDIFGENGGLHIGVGGRVGVEVGKGVGEGRDLEAATTVYLEGTAGLTVDAEGITILAASVGFHRDLGIQAAVKAKKFYEGLEESGDIDRYNEFVATEMDALESILPEELTDEQVRAMKNGAINLIEQEYKEGGLDALAGFQVTDAGIGGSLGVNKDSAAGGGWWGLHAYTVLSFKSKRVVVFSKPPHDMDATAQAKFEAEILRRTGAGETFQITVPGNITYDTRIRGDKHRAILDAHKMSKEVIAKHNENVGESGLKLERMGERIRLHAAGADGYVRVWKDPASDIDVMSDGQNIDLTLGSADSFCPIVVVKQYPVPVGGATNYMEIIITENPNPNIEEIKSASSSYYEWYQTADGRKATNPNGQSIIEQRAQEGGEDVLVRLEELEAILANISDPAEKERVKERYISDLSEKGAEKLIQEIRYTVVEVRGTRIERDLFGDIPRERQIELITFGEWMYKHKNKEIPHSMLEGETASGPDTEMHQKAIEYYNEYKASVPSLSSQTINYEERRIALQVLSQARRPALSKKPDAWNRKAMYNLLFADLGNETAAKSATEMAFQYWNNNWEELIKNPTDAPEGAKYGIHINASGTEMLSQNIYIAAIHGKIIGEVVWDAADPDKTLDAMGLAKTDANREHVRNIQAALYEKYEPTFEFKNVSEATFENTVYTMLGESMLQYADAIYGPDAGTILRDLAKNPTSVPAMYQDLVREFAEDVAKLALGADSITKTFLNEERKEETITIRKRSRVGSGFHGKCKNLSHYRLDEVVPDKAIKETRPEPHEIYSRGVRVRVNDFLAADIKVNFTGFALGFGFKQSPEEPTTEEEPEPEPEPSKKKPWERWYDDKPDLSGGLDRPTVQDNDADIGNQGTPTS